jgi:hypothetical protein
MTQTTELQVSETKSSSTSNASKQQLSEGAVKAFINGHIERVDGTDWLAVRTVVPCRFYRVNFYSSKKTDADLLALNKIIGSKFIEVVHNPAGLDLVDLTLTPKPNKGW